MQVEWLWVLLVLNFKGFKTASTMMTQMGTLWLEGASTYQASMDILALPNTIGLELKRYQICVLSDSVRYVWPVYTDWTAIGAKPHAVLTQTGSDSSGVSGNGGVYGCFSSTSNRESLSFTDQWRWKRLLKGRWRHSFSFGLIPL